METWSKHNIYSGLHPNSEWGAWLRREGVCGGVFSYLWGRGWELTVGPSKCVYSLVDYWHVFRSMVTDLEKT